MTSSTLEAVDLSIGLALDLDEFEQVLEDFPFVDEEERRNTIVAYEDTSQSSLDSFLQVLGQEFGIRKEGVLRLAGLLNLLRPWTSQSKASRPNGIPSTLFGVLKATLIAGHGLCANPAIVPAKLDRLSQRTIPISGDELSNISEDVAQGLFAQLASCIVEDCSKILRSGSRSEIQAFEPAVDRIDQICRNLEKETEKAQKAASQKKQADEQKRAADEEKVQKVQVWIEDMVGGDAPDKHDDYTSNRVAGTGAAFVCKVQEWLKVKEAPILVAHGSPGVGKTYLACAVISQHLEKPFEGVDGLAYTYFSYNDRDQQTPFVVYAGIITQLLRDSSQLREDMFRLFDENKKFARRHQSQIFQGLRRAVLSLKSTKLLVFDALDEASEKTRAEILGLLKSTRSDSPRMLVTSRSDFRESLSHEQVLSHHVHADADDIRAFSEDRLKNENVERIVRAHCRTVIEAQRFTSNLSEEILTNSHGFFLHAYYATKDVCGQVNISGIRNAASKRHHDANKIYAATLERIGVLAAPQKGLAYRTIAWLTFTKKPFEENELKEAFATSNVNGQVDPGAQIVIENVVEYCRGLVVRAKTRKLSYLRLAHLTAQEYFSQVSFFQQYQTDMCLTSFNHVLSCLIPNTMGIQEQDGLESQRANTHKEQYILDDVTDEDTSDSSGYEGVEELDSPNANERDEEEYTVADDGNDSDDEIDESLSEDSDSLTVFEDHQYWRTSGNVWPQTLLPWIAKKTPLSLYAGRYALSHLKESTVTPEIEKTVLKFIKTAISRRRRSTFSSKLQDHPYGMKMLHMVSFIGIPSVLEAVLGMPMTHVDDRDALGRTALMWALGLGKGPIAEKLLDEGAQVQAHDRRHRSTLMYASMVKDATLLTKILQKSPDSDISASLLFSCAKANNVFLLDGALSRANVDIDQIDENGRTPLHEAVINGSEAVVQTLIQNPIQLSILDSGGRTPLMHAAEGQNSGIVKALIRAGAKADFLSQNGESSLHIAAKNAEGGPRILRLLLRPGTNILVEDRNGLVPLQTLLRICQDQYRSEKDLLACVKLLSETPDSISHESHDGANVLHDAVRCQYLSVLRYLISRAPPNAINAQKIRGQTPIFEAVMAGNIPAFDLLIDLPGIDLLATRVDKKTLLNCAAYADEINVARKLIDKQPRLIKLAEGHGISAIHFAVERDNSSMFQMLLDAGSDPRSQRHTPIPNQDLISYAAFYGRVWCLETLLKSKAWMTYDQSGQLVAHRDSQGKTLLHEAAASPFPTALQKVLNSLPLEGLSLEDRDARGRTPLHYAAQQRKETPVSLLLAAGSDKDALTKTGDTALDLALEAKAIDVVRTLVLADAHVGQGSGPKSSDIRCYEKEDFFAKLVDITAVSSGTQRQDTKTYLQRCERIVHRVGTVHDVFHEWSPDIPFLEISVPEKAALPIDQVIFETVSHDQGWSGDSREWGGTYHHSHTFFDAAVQNVWTKTGNTEQRQCPRIRVQTNVHADYDFRTHVNVFDCAGPDQERSEWTQTLRRGDRIQLYAKAMYPGWQNYVQKAQIIIRYHDMDAGEGSGDASIEELPARIQKLSTLEQYPRKRAPSHQPKVVIYHQSLLAESGIPTSFRPLVQEKTGITALILGNFQIRMNHKVTDIQTQEIGDNSNVAIYLNEYTIEDSNIEEIWVDVEYLQAAGVKVIGLLSMCEEGDTPQGEQNSFGSWDDLTFERSYKALHDLVVLKNLDGFNLDTEKRPNAVNAEEKRVSLQGVSRLIDRLHTDFGPNFIIVMTASAEALLSSDTDQESTGIDYRTLEIQRGHLINWYNVRVFSRSERNRDQTNETRLPRTFKTWRVEDGTDARRDPASNFVRELNSYIRLLQHDAYRADKLLMAVSTTPNACNETLIDYGPYIDPLRLRSLLELLRWSYGPIDFGGVAGWEYSPARGSTTAGDTGRSRSPWLWAKETRAILESVFVGGE